MARRGGVVVVVAVLGYWLFADTVRHYRGAGTDPQVIRFAHFGSYQDYELWAKVIRAFEVQHPGWHVRQEYISGWYGLYDTKLRQQILAGTTPDVVLVQYAPFRTLAQHFEPLDDWWADGAPGADALRGLNATGLACFRVEGAQRGLPVSGGNLLIYCNVDCFEKAARHRGRAVPLPAADWTMADFRRTAEALTCDFDGDGQVDQFGFWQPRWVYYLPFIWSFGARVLDSAEGRWCLEGPEAEAALRFYQQLRYPHQVSPRPEEVAQIIQDVGFLTGKVGMCVNGPWFQPFLARTELARRYRVVPIPRGPGGRWTRVTWDGIAMRQGLTGARRERAADFVRFVCSLPVQRMLAEPQRALPALAAATEAFMQQDGGRNSQRFVEALAYSRLQPETPYFRALDRAINRHLARLLADPQRNSPAEVLRDLAADPAIRRHFTVGREKR